MAELNGVAIDDTELEALGLVNYGHFTSMLVEDAQVRGLSHHINRLVRDAQIVFARDMDADELRQYIRQAVGSRLGTFIVRVTVFDPELPLGKPSANGEPKTLVTTRRAAAWPPAPMTIQTAVYQRQLAHVKHIGLFDALWLRRQAQLNGFDDAMFVGPDGAISEGVTWNIAFFDGTNVIWPDADVLPGVTMKLLQQVHDETIVAPVNISDLSGMQAAFVANTAVGVRPISKIDDRMFDPNHEIIELLRKQYLEIPGEALG